jgi:hypothetical protein
MGLSEGEPELSVFQNASLVDLELFAEDRRKDPWPSKRRDGSPNVHLKKYDRGLEWAATSR